MCGIAGYLADIDKQTREETVSSMVRAMAHRGPDDEGIASISNLTFGHKRLSILDLSQAGHQPMASADGRYHIVYNGEVYNYRALRDQLSEYSFRSKTDTEVVLAAYAKWGMECLQKLNGMFAFAIWDKEREELFLARDRMGIKPLYYYANGGAFLFSSELGSLLASHKIKKQVSREELYQYLLYQTTHGPRTLIQGVSVLEPGHFMVISKAQRKTTCYWDITQIQQNRGSRNYKEICRAIKKALYEAVEKRLASDVPMGAFLSGGIDSSALVGVYSKVSPRRVSTFSVEFDDISFDESQYAKQVAERFKTDHHVVSVTVDQVFSGLPEILNSYDYPSADGLNSYMISQAVKKKGITVALSGLGADEVFGGYPIFSAAKSDILRGVSKLPCAMRAFLGNLAYKTKPSASVQKLKAYLSSREIGLQEFYDLFRAFLTRQQAASLIEGPYEDRALASFFAGLQASQTPQYQYKAVSSAEINLYLRNILLRDVDQMSMRHALEVRVPFLDHELVELALGASDCFKSGKPAKKLLVDSLEGLLPPEIIRRKKQGFVFPIEKWMRRELKTFCEGSLKSLSERELLAPGVILSCWGNFLKGDTSLSWMTIWSWVVLERWLERMQVEG